ncbi:MAG: glutamate--tRNA ligase [Candidatus Aenigmarchaeota archaeon]|nr:glutamate--tRNA ligase [Candidatus Aenigmarchaeota archaeon]
MALHDIERLAKAFAIQNAVGHDGKASTKAVIGRIVSERPEARKDIGKIIPVIGKIVNDINSLSIEEQKKELERLPEGIFEEKERRQELPELPKAAMGKVKTRFAPAPTGPLHISHILRAAYLSYLYARKYKGKFMLRLEDTDPKKVSKEFYDFIQQDLKSVGIEWDEFVIESSHVEEYLRLARRLIEEGKAYVCTCAAEAFRELKEKKKACPCRNLEKKRHDFRWESMLTGKYKEGEAVLRLKTSMRDKNPVLRDPPLMRIVGAEHPLLGKKYRVWPLYNFACVVEDHAAGITHVFRAKEHEHNTAVQAKVYDAFGLKRPEVINFGMIHLPGKKLHKRDMRKAIAEGAVGGWDDVSLPTIRALIRRGFQPKAFEELAKNTGLTKTDIVLSWENLEGINRKIIDPMANRYMAVINPVKLVVDADIPSAEMHVHPDFPDRGKRIIAVDTKSIFISQEDYRKFKGKVIRLIGFGNISLKGEAAAFEGDGIVKEMPKIQFVSRPFAEVEILRPDGTDRGYGEEALKRLPEGAVVHLIRIGFGRIDGIEGNKVRIAFAHK